MENTVTLKKNALNTSMMQKMLALVALIVLIIAFSIASPNFLTKMNIVSILLATAVNGVLATGVTFVIISGGIDLSLGTSMTFVSVITGVVITFMGLPIWLGVLAGLATGALIGFISGVNIAKLKLPPFIATLGMMMITKGLSLVVSGTKPIYFTGAEGFSNISTGTLFGIPNAVYILLVSAIIAHIILTKTVLGRYNFAIGSNEEATRLSGINTDFWKIAIYTLNGLFIGAAGILMAARLNSAQPALGPGYELDAIAAVVIGSTSMSGGKGTIVGTIIGAFIMSVLINGLRILSVPQQWQTVVTGVIVILAVFADIARRKKQ